MDSNLVVLQIGLLNGSIIGSLLLFRRNNRRANQLLAGLILILVLRVLVYLLGSQGLYDPHSWLYVPPLEVSLAYAPLIYLFVIAVTQSSPGSNRWLHLLPVAGQCLYYLSLLFLPNAAKAFWTQNVHLTVIDNIEAVLELISMSVYLFLSWRHYLEYQRWQADRTNAKKLHKSTNPLNWLGSFLTAATAFLIVWTLYLFADFWVDFNYHRHSLLFIAQSLLLCFLAFESWRHSEFVLDKMPPQYDGPQSIAEQQSKRADHVSIALQSQRAQEWLSLIETNEWWRDPRLTLTKLAQKLGTNTTTLSNTFNSGLKENFNSAINRIRIQAVCQALNGKPIEESLLDIALSAGFNSKNSFNRSFKKFTGMTPSEYRRQLNPK